ncbi:MAG TPA: carboxymuconolactone decarboxylase family protein [Stellaceae bacterium]|jgi:4-carboxymuconolactone decarboxylase|nr:carboxymuconolactone decarboxylase family protein [Stellaceae bacterium]
MTTQRLGPIALDAMTPEQRRVADALISGPRGAVRGPFPALLRRPELADCARAMGDCIRATSSLPLPLREIAILTTARHWDASYEWGAHVKIAREIGMDMGVVETIKARHRPDSADAETLLVYDFTTQALQNHDIADETYARALARFGEAGIVDLIGIVGYFSFACMIFNLTRMPPNDPADQLTA